VRTINWMFAYFPTAWTRYRVMYSARLRLIDVKRSQVIAEGSCSRIPEETPNAPTFDQLVADKAALLKRELAVAAEHCARVFGTGTLALAQPVTMVAALAPQPAPAASAAAPARAQAAPSPKGSTLVAALGTPMPDDLALVAPATDVPPALAAFSGVWSGRWGLGAVRQHTLVVERIDGRNAKLVYSLGKAPPRATVPDPTFSRVVGVFDDDGSLRATLANGAVVIYRLSEDRHSLVGDWTQNVQHFQGILQRQELP
jgi:hypothetical protein